MQSQHYPLNTLFKPSLSMKMWYRGGIALIFGLILLFTYVPAVLFVELPAVFSLLIFGEKVILYAHLWYWVGLFYESMWYELRDDEINWKRGVWFRTTRIIAITASRISMYGRDRSCAFLGSQTFLSRQQVTMGSPCRRS